MPRDTTPEFAARYNAWWSGLTGQERLDWWQRRNRDFAVARYNQIRQANPRANEQEVLALWTEQTYRDSMAPERLAWFCERIRNDPRPVDS